ncbi:MAG TPA: hypothetical protein VF997_19380 [Polyangia bacterium]
MRSPLPLLLLAAAGCGSSSSTSKDLQAGPDLATLSCSQTVDARCAAGGGCVRDLTAAQQPSSWCPDGGSGAVGGVTLQHCAGGQTVIVVTYVDSSDHFVYASGALVAIFSSLPHAADSLVCVAGPATFAAPSGCDTPTTLCA